MLATLYFLFFWEAVCGGAHGQKTSSTHWFDGDGRFSSVSYCCHGVAGKFLWSSLLNQSVLNKAPKVLCVSVLRRSGAAQMDVLHQHCGHLQLRSLLWNRPRPHPLVHCGRALQPGAPACCHCSCRFLQLVCQLLSGNVLPVCWGERSLVFLGLCVDSFNSWVLSWLELTQNYLKLNKTLFMKSVKAECRTYIAGVATHNCQGNMNKVRSYWTWTDLYPLAS